MTAQPTSICSGWTKSSIARTARRLLPPSMTTLNGRHGLQLIPYLETREKEDAFLRRVTEAIEQGLTLCTRRYAPSSHLLLPPIEAPYSRGRRTFRRHWTLQTASDTTIALVWYYCRYQTGALLLPRRSTKTFGHELYKRVLPNGRG